MRRVRIWPQEVFVIRKGGIYSAMRNIAEDAEYEEIEESENERNNEND